MIENADDYRRLKKALGPAPVDARWALAATLAGAVAMAVLVVLGLVWNATGLPVLDEPTPTIDRSE